MKKINENFECINCKRIVNPAEKTCRNHCPFCFISLHVDGDVPWDRNTSCYGVMNPINYEIKHGKKRILFRCEKCGKEHWNKSAEDDDFQVIIELLKPRWI